MKHLVFVPRSCAFTARPLCLAIAAVVLHVGQAAAQTTVGIDAAEVDDEVSRRGAAAYWTPERVESAAPAPWYDAEADGVPAHGRGEVPVSDSGFVVPGGLPGQRLPSPVIEVPTGGSWNDSSLEAEGVVFGTQDVGDNDYVDKTSPQRRLYPYRTIGKLLFTAASGGSSYCSASVVSGNDIVVTAAHCCWDRGVGDWGSNYSFVPAMRRSDQSVYGAFPWLSARVLTAWIDSGGRQNDVCVLTLGSNDSGQTVSNTVGWLGRSWNFGATQHMFAFGYPSNIDGGDYKYECSAESYANCGDDDVLAMGCNMTNGSSGGPWVRTLKRGVAGATNFVNSVVSGYDGCTGTFGLSFNGARFTDRNILPLCNDEGC